MNFFPKALLPGCAGLSFGPVWLVGQHLQCSPEALKASFTPGPATAAALYQNKAIIGPQTMEFHQLYAFSFYHGVIQKGQKTKKTFQAGFAQPNSVLVSFMILSSQATPSPEHPWSLLSWPLQDSTIIPWFHPWQCIYLPALRAHCYSSSTAESPPAISLQQPKQSIGLKCLH